MASAADRLKEYEKLFQQSQSYDTSKFQSDFEKAYNEATNYNKDLIDQKAQAIGQAQALPNQLREQYYSSPIRNPLAQESLISTRRGNITSDITGLTDLLQARGARYQDVLGKYLSAYESEARRAQTAAENMWRMYQDALAQEEAARARAAAAAQQRYLEDLLKQTTQTEEGPQYAEVEEEERGFGNDMVGSIARANAAVNQAQDPFSRVKAYVNEAGWNLLNPVYGIGYATTRFNDLLNKNRKSGSSW